MHRIEPILISLCQQPIREKSLHFRRKGLSDWNGQDIMLCGAPAKFTVDGMPTCSKHARRFTANNEREPK